MRKSPTATALANDVRKWIADNPKAPPQWRGIAERLATSPDMAQAWRELAKRGVQGTHVLSMVLDATRCAAEECRRMPLAEEAVRLRAVENAAHGLIKAIDRAPLLDKSRLIEVDGHPMAFAWRAGGSQVAKVAFPVPVIDLTALLQAAAELVAEELRRTRNRTVKRKRTDPVAASFVRHLSAMIQQATGQKLMGTVARVATAALDREAISKEQVEAIIRKPSG